MNDTSNHMGCVGPREARPTRENVTDVTLHPDRHKVPSRWVPRQ